MSQQIRVTFEPQGRSVFVLPGTKILEAAADAGLTVETPCGGAGLCGKCRVQIVSGACPPAIAEERFFAKEELDEGWRLACQSCLSATAVVRIPEASIFASQHQILAERQDASAREVLPAIRKLFVEMPPPSLSDCRGDLLRLEEKVGPFKAGLRTLQRISGRMYRNGYKGTAVLTDHRLIDFEEGDTTRKCYGAAFDIGTTTVVGSLMDLTTGQEVAIASGINPQVSYGDDVVSRIQHASSGPEGMDDLRKAIIECVGAMLCQLSAQSGVRAEHIYEIAFAGNTTMQHLLCGLNVEQLGVSPFVPPCGRGLMLSASEMGLDLHPQAAAYVFPVIGGFVGGDTVAGILATRLPEKDSPALMVDIGTNGEIVLLVDGRLSAASTAAGPAFEGARIRCGMRGATGAIEKVVLGDDVECEVIGDVPPIGICGSGLIDVAAELLETGIVTPEGRMLEPGELPEPLSEKLRRRVRLDGAGQPRFHLAGGDGQTEVFLTQRDIRELQLASGAIRAGITILLQQAGLRTTDLKVVYIAGGFGSYIRREHAQRIGLLPPDIDPKRIHYVGNTSLSGARWALLSTKARQHAEDLARQTAHVELSRDLDFQRQFAECMIFPES